MRHLARFALGMLLAVLLCNSTVAAEGKPFRHLVFNVGVTMTTQNDTLVGGIDSGGSQTAHSGGGIVATGSITADFIGITADNAFRIQIAENTDTRKAPPVAVDVTSDGNVRLPQNQMVNVTDEEQTILPMLARYFVTDDGVSAGQWTRKSSVGKNSDDETYRLTSQEPSGDIKIDMEQRINVRDAQPFDTTTHGSITYSIRYKVPRAVVIESRTHRESVQGAETDNTKAHFDLVTDSFQTGS
ncbi:MAG: hypothetical protein GIW98_03650 [Candidatus Eremiobacteraeota bacterium]|nr:hypothetical protein [Candidatus Eremiobacteraeota bacterium]